MRNKYNPHLDKTVISEDNFIATELMDGSSPDMNVDGSSVAVTFKAVPSSGKYWMITRLLFYYSTAGVAFSEEKFANLSALTNGISVRANNGEIVNWKDNVDVNTSMFDADGKPVYTKLDKSISGRMSFHKFGEGKGIKINDDVNGFAIIIQDNLETLSQFRARVEGIEFNKG